MVGRAWADTRTFPVVHPWGVQSVRRADQWASAGLRLGGRPAGGKEIHARHVRARPHHAVGAPRRDDRHGRPGRAGLGAPGHHHGRHQGLRRRRHGQGDLPGDLGQRSGSGPEHAHLLPHRDDRVQRCMGRLGRRGGELGQRRPRRGGLCRRLALVDRHPRQVGLPDGRPTQGAVGVRLLPLDQRQHRFALPRHPCRGHGLGVLPGGPGGLRDLPRHGRDPGDDRDRAGPQVRDQPPLEQRPAQRPRRRRPPERPRHHPADPGLPAQRPELDGLRSGGLERDQRRALHRAREGRRGLRGRHRPDLPVGLRGHLRHDVRHREPGHAEPGARSAQRHLHLDRRPPVRRRLAHQDRVLHGAAEARRRPGQVRHQGRHRLGVDE